MKLPQKTRRILSFFGWVILAIAIWSILWIEDRIWNGGVL